MGLLSKLSAVTAGRSLAKKNAPTVHRGIDSVASAVKGRLSPRHGSKVDSGASMAKRAITGTDRPEAPGRSPEPSSG